MMNDRDYLNGSPLWDAIFQFGNAELVEIYAAPLEYKRNKPEGGLGDIVNSALKGLLDIQNQAEQRQKILAMLKKDIVAQIEKGDLIPYGFKDPRNIEDHPIKIPADLFYSGEINWEDSELKYKAFEFSGIRLLLLSEQNSQPEIKPINKIEENNSPEKSKKAREKKPLNFSDLNPEIYIDEKQASVLLGISVKTLQGYRVKGGGPEYSKFGPKMVRYQICILREWAEGRKKKNTSQ